MLTGALLEREIRTSTTIQGLAGIRLYPELRNCRAPSAPRILEIFDDLTRHQLITTGDQVVQTFQTFQPQLTPLQQQVLDLLHIPASVYNTTDTPRKWGPTSTPRSAERQLDARFPPCPPSAPPGARASTSS